jgi:3-phenylpropionate/trans-cinnamate dioxygenase ferredoxin subunit
VPFSFFRARPSAQRKLRLAGGALLGEGEARRVYLGGRQLIVAKVEGQYRAIAGLCTHWPELITPTVLPGCQVKCPVHWATFDLRTGKATSGPTRRGVAVYPVAVAEDDLLIELPD